MLAGGVEVGLLVGVINWVLDCLNEGLRDIGRVYMVWKEWNQEQGLEIWDFDSECVGSAR